MIDLANPEGISADFLYRIFLRAFQFYQQKKFITSANDNEAATFAYTLSLYFACDEKFFESTLLNDLSLPHLSKGLIIIGSYGVGKTSVMNTFHRLFEDARQREIEIETVDGNYNYLCNYPLRFASCSAIAVTREYEFLANLVHKQEFWRKYSGSHKLFIDDLATENVASNFGKIEIFKDILELRYERKRTTHIAMNRYGQSVRDTFDYLQERYGPRIYDRLFEMCNVIELNGKSLRK